MKEYDSDIEHFSADFYLLHTGVLVEDPDADIRFMFLSKEGIRLPDSDGRIFAELRKPELDVQKINALLWEQAIIWPITHFADGLWAKDSIDFSLINLLLPATDLSWLGWK